MYYWRIVQGALLCLEKLQDSFWIEDIRSKTVDSFRGKGYDTAFSDQACRQ
jgi:hypothetical protein